MRRAAGLDYLLPEPMRTGRLGKPPRTEPHPGRERAQPRKALLSSYSAACADRRVARSSSTRTASASSSPLNGFSSTGTR
jgi:hypothetical protein